MGIRSLRAAVSQFSPASNLELHRAANEFEQEEEKRDPPRESADDL
jgi:hypothetical protein